MLAAIEFGGTKIVCAISDDNGNNIEKLSIPTTTPEESMGKIIEFFKKFNDIKAMGVSCFGPIDINEDSETYGYILNTPKLKWKNVNVLGILKREFPETKFAWTTDVNGAAMGEYRKGAAFGKNSCLYITIGTGVGGGIVFDGKINKGTFHPEMGHIGLPVINEEENKYNICPFHTNCLEGFVCGPSIKNRKGISAEDIVEDDEVWDIISHYIAQGLYNFALTIAPEIIIVGGGVANQKHIFPRIWEEFKKLNNYYIKFDNIEEYIVPTKLGNESGIIGSIELAKDLIN